MIVYVEYTVVERRIISMEAESVEVAVETLREEGTGTDIDGLLVLDQDKPVVLITEADQAEDDEPVMYAGSPFDANQSRWLRTIGGELLYRGVVPKHSFERSPLADGYRELYCSYRHEDKVCARSQGHPWHADDPA